MKHLLHKLSSLRLLTLLAVLLGMGGSTAWAVSEGDTFTRISSLSELSNGDEIIFVNQAETYACGKKQNDNNRTPVSITVSDHSYTYATADKVQVFVFRVNPGSGSSSDNYGFHTGSGYIFSASDNNNYLQTNSIPVETVPYTTSAWKLSFSNSVATVTNAKNTSYYLAFNGTSIFSQYKSGYFKPYIYKKQTPYTVANVIDGKADGKTNIFVEGYIVGSWKNDAFNASDLVDTNLALADSYDSNATIPVELPSGSLQTSWGPASNQQNVRVAKVRIKGNGDTFCSTNGITGVSVITKVAEAVKISDASGFATYASDSPLDFTDKDIDAYIAVTKGNGTGVTFTQVNKVPANTGLLIHYSGAKTEEIPVFDGTGADAVTGNTFVQGTGATVATDDGDNYNYILNKVGSNIGFYRANDKKVALNRAYISILKSESGSSVKEFLTFEFGEADAIGDIRGKMEDVRGEIFNLAGQRINRLQKGINIVNGRKVFMK